MIFYNLAIFGLMLIGFVFLWLASERVVKSSIYLAEQIGVSTFLVGSIISSAMASFPEFVVAVASIIHGVPGGSLGGIFGSNLCNLTLVLAVPILICSKLSAKQTEVQSLLFMLMMIGLSMFLVLIPGVRPKIVGPIFMAIYFAIIIVLIKRDQKDLSYSINPLSYKQNHPCIKDLLITCSKLLSSLVVTTISSNVVVFCAKTLSESTGILLESIGAIIFAIATAIPELSINITAARLNQPALILGSSIGSVLSQTLFVMGFLATFSSNLNFSSMIYSAPWIFFSLFVIGFYLLKNNELGKISAFFLTIIYICFCAITVKLGLPVSF